MTSSGRGQQDTDRGSACVNSLGRSSTWHVRGMEKRDWSKQSWIAWDEFEKVGWSGKALQAVVECVYLGGDGKLSRHIIGSFSFSSQPVSNCWLGTEWNTASWQVELSWAQRSVPEMDYCNLRISRPRAWLRTQCLHY